MPLGVDPRTVPNIPVHQGPSFEAPSGESTALTMYVRSAIGQTSWFAVLTDHGLVAGQGYGRGLGVGCIDVEPGNEIVLLDRPPKEAGATPRRVMRVRDRTSDQPVVWVDIAADGSIAQGEGLPGWWPGVPQAC